MWPLASVTSQITWAKIARRRGVKAVGDGFAGRVAILTTGPLQVLTAITVVECGAFFASTSIGVIVCIWVTLLNENWGGAGCRWCTSWSWTIRALESSKCCGCRIPHTKSTAPVNVTPRWFVESVPIVAGSAKTVFVGDPSAVTRCVLYTERWLVANEQFLCVTIFFRCSKCLRRLQPWSH